MGAMTGEFNWFEPDIERPKGWAGFAWVSDDDQHMRQQTNAVIFGLKEIDAAEARAKRRARRRELSARRKDSKGR